MRGLLYGWKELFACILFLLLQFFGSCLGLTIMPSPWFPVIMFTTALLGFLVVCAIAVYSKPNWQAFLIGLCFGIAPGMIPSVFIGIGIRLILFPLADSLAVTPNNLMNMPRIIYLILGAFFWGLAAIPVCTLFRWISACIRKNWSTHAHSIVPLLVMRQRTE